MKKLAVAVLLLVTLLAAVIVFGSIDADSYNDMGLLAVIREVPDEDNGYREVSYLFDQKFEQFPHPDIGLKLKEYINLNDWDDAIVNSLIDKNKRYIDSAIASTAYPMFKFSLTEDPTNLPRYDNIIFVSRLLLLQAIVAAKSGQLDQASRLTSTAIIFSQRVKLDENHLLISRMIGLVLQFEALQWSHYFVHLFELNRNQLAALSVAIANMPRYEDDAFHKAFAGELLYSINIIDSQNSQTLSEKWQNLAIIIDTWAFFDKSGQIHTAKDKVSQLLLLLFPTYSVHKNRILNDVAKNDSELAEQASKYCDKIDLRSEVEAEEPYWWDILKPNGSGLMLTPVQNIYGDYFTRRCFAHVYLESIQTIIALKKYQLDRRASPASLDDLIPNYLKRLPVDPFNGQPLKYAKSSQWLYSVGANYEDNGGSRAGYFIRRCDKSEDCASNPTIPIALQADP